MNTTTINECNDALEQDKSYVLPTYGIKIDERGKLRLKAATKAALKNACTGKPLALSTLARFHGLDFEWDKLKLVYYSCKSSTLIHKSADGAPFHGECLKLR